MFDTGVVACSFESCNRQSLRKVLEAFKCTLCQHLFCLYHRNPEAHECGMLLRQSGYSRQVQQEQQHTRHKNLIQKIFSKAQSAAPLPGGANHFRESSSTSETQRQRTHFPSDSKSDLRHRLQLVDRARVRAKCTGDTAVPNYDRVHVRIMLVRDQVRRRVGVTRHHPPGTTCTAGRHMQGSVGDSQAQSQSGPSDSTGSGPTRSAGERFFARSWKAIASSRRDSSLQKSSPKFAHIDAEEVYIWFDRSRSVGNCIDFLMEHALLAPTGGDEQCSLCLVASNTSEAHPSIEVIASIAEFGALSPYARILPYPARAEAQLTEGGTYFLGHLPSVTGDSHSNTFSHETTIIAV